MDEITKQLDEFTTDFFKEVKLQFKTTDINIIGNIVELPVNSDLVKLCMLYTRMYVDRFHRGIDRDTLNALLIKMKKPILVTDSVLKNSECANYNKVIDDIINIIK